MINHKLEFKEGVSYLRLLREKVDISQQQLAILLDCSVTSVSRWETGVHSVNLNAKQWKALYNQVLVPLGIDINDLPDDLGAPYVKAA